MYVSPSLIFYITVAGGATATFALSGSHYTSLLFAKTQLDSARIVLMLNLDAFFLCILCARFATFTSRPDGRQ